MAPKGIFTGPPGMAVRTSSRSPTALDAHEEWKGVDAACAWEDCGMSKQAGPTPAAGSTSGWIPQAVREARRQKGIAQESLAHRSDINRGHMGAIERGLHEPTFNWLMQVLEGLQIEPCLFFRDWLPQDVARCPGKPRRLARLQRRPGDTYLVVVGAALKCERERANFTQMQFCAAVGISRSHLSAIETGKANPSVALVLRLLAAMDIVDRDVARFFRCIRLLENGIRRRQ
jgi:transcriptional regulator with XRE-family HTH domain